jgi:long-chain acyl-CoA synthetase
MMRRGEGNDIWFVARKKDIIIRSGTNISPIEVEEALVASHPAVKEAVVVGKPDPVLGQRVFAFVKLTAKAKKPAVSEILDKVGQRLAAYKVPEDLIVLDDLPRNASSKVDRVRLKAMLSERQRNIAEF